MSIASKVKGLLSLTDHKTSDLSECLGMSVQSVRNKFSRDSLSVPDLIKICEYLDCELLIQTKGKQAVYFDVSDIKQESDNLKNADKSEA